VRFLGLVEVKPQDRHRFFLRHHAAGTWSAATCNAYWGAVVSALQTLGIPLTPVDKETGKTLDRLAGQEIGRPPMAMEYTTQLVFLQKLQTHLTSPPSLWFHLLAVVLAFAFGQRIADILQIHENDVVPHDGGMCITIRRGKVVPLIGPYVLQVRQGIVSLALWTVAHRRHNSPIFPAETSQAVRRLLKQQHPALELRSIRRGGLSHLAKTVPLDALRRHFSKHASEAMLLRYLGHGAAAREIQDLHHIHASVQL
jgi:integrase